jgi:threonine/homoserine/homoserine lactone efflux protein
MTQIFLSGVILGLTLAIMLGPAFFSLLQTSVKRGFRSGLYMAAGIILSDLTLVMLSYFGLSRVMSEPGNQVLFGIVGGVILIVYGAFTFRKKTQPAYNGNDDDNDVGVKIQKPRALKYILKGYFLNLVNPFLLIFWVGVMTVLAANYGARSNEVLVFFSGTLITVLATDVFKCFIAHQIKRYLRPRILSFFNHAVGLLLIIFGLVLIIKVITEL